MASWKCARCGWENSGSWNKCAKCGLERMTEREYGILTGAEKDLAQIRPQIEEYRASKAAKWEYLVVFAGLDNEKNWKIHYRGEDKPYEKLTDILEELGRLGWELVGVSSSVGSEKPWISNWTYTFTSGEQFYFKRPYVEIPAELRRRLDNIADSIPGEIRGKLDIPR